MASEDDAIWYVVCDNAQRGPLKQSQVLSSIRNGTVNGADLVWRPGFEKWLPLREVREFWTPPSAAQRKTETAPPAIPQADVLTKQPDEKWSLWGAATGGLVLSSAVLWTSGLSKGGYMLANFGYWPNAELIANLIGQLSFGPLLFVLIAVIRNTVKRRSLRPSSVSAGRRAAAFFGILMAVGISLRIFGTFYFSHDEIIDGEARADIVKSFVSGCFQSQKAAAVNAGFSDTQVSSFCTCLANSVASTLTYKQLAAGNFMEDSRRIAEQAAPSCRVK
jgi:GYF domain 2